MVVKFRDSNYICDLVFLTKMLVMCGLNNTICGKFKVATISH